MRTQTNPEKKLIIQIILDGFDSSYLAEAPFLSKGIGSGYGRPLTIPTPFGARGSIFSGTLPGKNQNFTDLWRDPEQSRLKRFTFLKNSTKPLPQPLRTVTRIATRIVTGYPCRIPANMPANYLTRFDTPNTSKQFSTFKPQKGMNTLIDYLQSNNVNFQYFGPPYSSFWEKPLSQLSKVIKPQSKYVFVHIVSPDISGHTFGPTHQNTKTLIQHIDAELNLLCKVLKKDHQEATLIIHSDHGMSKVTKKIDWWHRIVQWSLTPGIDFDFFLDSTVARFWILKQNKRQLLIECIKKDLPEASFISSLDLGPYNLGGLSPQFGDFFAVIPEGTVISPCFYQAEPARGMHGYFHSKSTGLIAWSGINSPLTNKDTISILDIFPTILKLLGIPLPQSLDGNPIFTP